MQPIPYLFFNGRCGEAVRTYARIFGTEADLELLTFEDCPPGMKAQMPEVEPQMVMHAAVKVGEGRIFASDDFGKNSPAMAGCNVHVSLPTAEEAHRVFDALAEGGEVRMALEPQFWTPLFGTLTDRFGTRWMVSQDGPAG